jgi:hypothetical protein
MKKRVHELVSLGLAAAVLLAPAAHAEESRSAAAFAWLSSLVGEWHGVHDGHDISVTYTLIADKSVLMEEFRPAPDSAMMTMFSPDGDRLIATHYCSAGNQPQMSTNPITDVASRSLAFSLLRVTGMKTPDDWHNTGLKIVLEDPNHLTQTWTYLYNGEVGTRVFRFERMPS